MLSSNQTISDQMAYVSENIPEWQDITCTHFLVMPAFGMEVFDLVQTEWW